MDPKAGGPPQGLRNVIPALARRGVVDEVVCLDSPEQPYTLSDPFPIHKLGPSRSSWAHSPRLSGWLTEHLPRFDAVVIHGLWQYPAYAATREVVRLRAAGGKAPQLFVMPHGMLDPWFQRDKSRRLKAWRNWAYWKLIERHTIEAADALLFTCQRELELAREAFAPYRPRAEINVGYGVQPPPAFGDAMTAAFEAACPAAAGRPYLLLLSRIHPKKGVDLLIQAYAKLRDEPDGGAHLPLLVIAGPTDAPYAAQMIELAKSIGLLVDDRAHKGPGIAFPGMLQGDAKWGAFYGCEAFVLPSHQENFGIAVVEALACGKPVLISEQVNIWDEIITAGAGIAFADTAAGVEGALRQWLACGESERQGMSQRALSCYRQNYSPEEAAARLHAALQQVSRT